MVFLLQYKIDDAAPKLRTFRSELRMLEDDVDFDAPDWSSVLPKTTSQELTYHASVLSSPGGAESLERRTARVIEITKQECFKSERATSSMFGTTTASAVERVQPSAVSKRKAEQSSAMTQQQPSRDVNIPVQMRAGRRHNVQTVFMRRSSTHGHYNASSLGTSNLNMSLYDAIKSGVYDVTRGVFVDPFSGEIMTLKQAAARKAINANVREIVHPISKQRLTLKAVLNTSLIDSDQGFAL